jgi:hypothetical protein
VVKLLDNKLNYMGIIPYLNRKSREIRVFLKKTYIWPYSGIFLKNFLLLLIILPILTKDFKFNIPIDYIACLS